MSEPTRARFIAQAFLSLTAAVNPVVQAMILGPLEGELHLTPQRLSVLQAVSAFPNLSLKELASRLAASSPALSSIIEGMVAEGLVTRVPDPADRRRVLINLTVAGAALLTRAQDLVLSSLETWVLGMPDDSQTKLQESLACILDVVSPVSGSRPAGKKGC